VLVPMSPVDSLFLTVETRQRPMHLGGLHLFRPPADAGPSYLQDLLEALTQVPNVAPLFRKRPARAWLFGGQWGWQDDEQFDIEHHVRHNALPRPGRVLELLALTSRLHSTLLDRSRPLWEAHVIEGLDDGRFAVYVKIHHALVDGVAAARLLQSVMSADPAARNQPAPWAVQDPRSGPKSAPAAEASPAGREEGSSALPAELLRQAVEVARQTVALPSVLARTVARGVRAEPSPVSYAAPKTIFNVPISGARRFAAQSWPIERLRQVGRANRATVNDVVLAMCSGALRGYLSDLDALPDAPLIALVPVALRTRDRDRQQGNAVGAVMCNLGTDRPSAAERLAQVKSSMNEGKAELSSLSTLQLLAMTAVGMGPLLLQSTPGLHQRLRPPFNLIISNVPGSRRPLYLNGARMEGVYPLSIPFDGQALNITCTSYVSDLAFGLTGCRRSVPHLQRLLAHLDQALADLEAARPAPST
jgi:diacylglycerol O-acyltransferase